jgi:DNA-binding transcriptional MerR regulator
VAEYRVDEVALRAGTTVRNVRAYQDRGLLPPPRRDGRVGLYGEAHLARLQLIGRLLERGYTLANIEELVGAWERGHELGDLLGLEQAITGPWSDEAPGWVTEQDLARMFPDGDGGTLARAVELGFLVPEGDRYRVPSPRQLHAGAELVAAGVPLPAVLDHAGGLRDDVDRIAERFVTLVAGHVLGADRDLAGVTEVVRRLRPLASVSVAAELARAMQHHALDLLGDHLAEPDSEGRAS